LIIRIWYQQVSDPLLQDTVGRQADGVADVLGLEQLVDLGLGEAGVTAEVEDEATFAVARDHRFEHVPPALRAVAVPSRALLLAVGRTFRAVHVEDDAVRWATLVHPVNSGARQSHEGIEVCIGG
jgi:hypothetical protein